MEKYKLTMEGSRCRISMTVDTKFTYLGPLSSVAAGDCADKDDGFDDGDDEGVDSNTGGTKSLAFGKVRRFSHLMNSHFESFFGRLISPALCLCASSQCR